MTSTEALPRTDDARALAGVRDRLAEAGYTTEAIEERLGGGRISFAPAEVAVHLHRLRPGEAFSTLVRLLLLGLSVPADEADRALGEETRLLLERSGWFEARDGALRATLKLVPHGDLLIASDHDAEGPTGADWVAGMHPPSVTLAKLTVRRPVARALDVATGNGIQALLASRHAEKVVATDINPRALDVAALNAGLNGVRNVELRQGSFFDPVQGERFDLVTCNPPYVISPESRYAYRDSGLPGDTVSRRVVERAASALDEGGFAHVLVSWAHRPDDQWGPLERWVEGSGCDCLLLWFGSDDPVTHAGEWLRPVAARDRERHRASLEQWLEYLEGHGIDAIAHGAVLMRRRSRGPNWVRREAIELDRLEQASEHVLRLFASQDRLAALEDPQALLAEPFALVEHHRLEQTLRYRAGEPELQGTALALEEGLGFRVAVDLHTTRLLPVLDGRRPLGDVLAERSAELGLGPEDAADFARAALPVVGRLVELGFLVPGTA